MATCIVSTSDGRKVAEVRFLSSPPDTHATVISSSGQAVGSIESRHSIGEGTVYDAHGNTVGTLFGNAIVDDVPCMAMNSTKDVVGGVVNAHQVMAGPGPDRWTAVGAVETGSWTSEDDQGLTDTMISLGKGDPGPDSLPTFVNIVQIKQRNLAGVAALLLGLLPTSVTGVETQLATQPLAAAPAMPATTKQDGSLSWLYLSFDGRIGRQTYWLKGVVPYAVIYIVLVFISAMAGGNENQLSGAQCLVTILLLLLIWPLLAVTVKRWHDRDKSGWWVLIGLIPIIGSLWALIETGFLKGTDGPNRYGPEPS